jgi:exopolyphosphatase/guanosine-5'-triphosphate,3'-diphosphate pyrophosphatase
MLIATPAPVGFRVLDSYNRVVRLGEGLQSSGQLSDSAMDRAVEALQACAERLARRPVREVRSIATEACRRATNTPVFVERVARQTGLRLDVISTREEATLALEGCTPLLAPGRGRALLFDIGGGSTELVWVRITPGRDPELIGTLSIPIGVVALSERYGPDAFTSRGFNTMVADVLDRLLPFERIYRIADEVRRGGVQLLGTSGTVTTLAGQYLELDRYRRLAVDGQILSRTAAGQAVSALRGMGRERLAAHPCVGAERADYVLPGCAIYTAISTLWPVSHVTVADRGVREGMLLRLIRQRWGARRP